MANKLFEEICAFVSGDQGNRLPQTGGPIFDVPIIQCAAANDPLFGTYKTVVGPEHLTPAEIFERSFGASSFNDGSVVVISLPIHKAIREAARQAKEISAREWILARTYGDEIFMQKLAQKVEVLSKAHGYRAVCPRYASWYKIIPTGKGPAALWSERHAAYAAGLGTFSHNDAFITEKGAAVRLLSFITDAVFPANKRTAGDHLANCPYCADGSCGACIKRCPAGAITAAGHDKAACYQYVYGPESQGLAAALGLPVKHGSGCGFCQTGVPCEDKIPGRKTVQG